jgi:hypothetical protein
MQTGTGALRKIVLPASDNHEVCACVEALGEAILQEEIAIRARHEAGLAEIRQEIRLHQTQILLLNSRLQHRF